MTFTAVSFRPSNLSRESAPWGRQVEDRIAELERAAARSDGDGVNANKVQNSSIRLVTKNISNIQASVNAAIASITINPSQINAGALPGAISIDAGQIVSGTVARDVNAGNVTGTNGFFLSVNTNITASRVAVWGRTSDGFIGTAVSDERQKTNIKIVDWDDAKLEAAVSISLRYYEWIANVEAKKTDPSVQSHTEVGFLAQEMHEAGLWEFVVYERNPDDSLMLNTETKQPIPIAIHYMLWSLAQHLVIQRLWSDRKADRSDLDLVLSHLGLKSIKSPTE